ncbi:MAG: hypothetical protein HYZ25_21630 [Chloroflexi bacterium]|nr:hypothetical protein [Chloroflexota bacterium]
MQMQTVLNFLKRPIVMVVLAAIVGIALGLAWGWGVDPVKFVDATPAYLRDDLREDYLRMTIDSFRVNADPNLAVQRWQSLGQFGPELLQRVTANPKGLDPNTLAAFTQLAGQFPPTAASQGGGTTSVSGWVLSIFLIALLALAVAGGFIFLRRLLAKSGGGEPTVSMQAVEASRNAERTDFEGLGLAPPITQVMTTYLLGDDLYDESFSIDTQGGEFLGEYGVGVSETVGVGDPKKVTALEVWLFDKNDIKTATKVLMSEHAFNDQNLRSRLEPKGELVLVEPHKQIILETETLQLLATVADLQYGQAAPAGNSYFERLTLELAIWPKGG